MGSRELELQGTSSLPTFGWEAHGALTNGRKLRAKVTYVGLGAANYEEERELNVKSESTHC